MPHSIVDRIAVTSSVLTVVLTVHNFGPGGKSRSVTAIFGGSDCLERGPAVKRIKP